MGSIRVGCERNRSLRSRRSFILGTGGALLGRSFLTEAVFGGNASGERRIAPVGPASKYTPVIHAAFVRRKGDYGMRWPGQIYDGAAALEKYRRLIEQTADELKVKAVLAPAPIHALEEADAWLAGAKADKPDGLLVVLLDRQEHAWPTAAKAIDSRIPTVIFAPIGAAFTVNTWDPAKKTGAFICSTDNFAQVAYGMKMIKAAAKLREMRYIVLKGNARKDTQTPAFGTRLRYVPAKTFLDEYQQTTVTDELRSIAAEYMKNATKIAGPTEQDVLNGVKSYVVARTIMEREEGDGITMDCLGALGRTQVSLPCIAWSRMLDHGIPAACEADLNAALTHALVQYLFDRPGFQQDPVPETAKDCLIGAHCTCPTRLNGFAKPAEPYYLSYHHGKRDAVPRPMWREKQRVTVAQIALDKDPQAIPRMYISAGTVVGNVAVPPAGGCVVSVEVKLDGVSDYLGYPGFHQVFFYGDFKKELCAYCRLFNIQSQVV